MRNRLLLLLIIGSLGSLPAQKVPELGGTLTESTIRSLDNTIELRIVDLSPRNETDSVLSVAFSQSNAALRRVMLSKLIKSSIGAQDVNDIGISAGNIELDYAIIYSDARERFISCRYLLNIDKEGISTSAGSITFGLTPSEAIVVLSEIELPDHPVTIITGHLDLTTTSVLMDPQLSPRLVETFMGKQPLHTPQPSSIIILDRLAEFVMDTSRQGNLSKLIQSAKTVAR